MRVPCYCGAYLLDPENATYVKDGKPMCHAHTCHIYAKRNEVAMRRVPFSDVEPPRAMQGRFADI